MKTFWFSIIFLLTVELGDLYAKAEIYYGYPKKAGTYMLTLMCKCHKVTEAYIANITVINDSEKKRDAIAAVIPDHSHFRVTKIWSATMFGLRFECSVLPDKAVVIYTRGLDNTGQKEGAKNWICSPNSSINSNDYVSAVISCSGTASGLAWDQVNQGSIEIGTNRANTFLNTVTGLSAFQTLSNIKALLMSSGFQNVSVNTPDGIKYNLEFQLDCELDTILFYAFDDSGLDMTYTTNCSCFDCDSCIIEGPSHIPINTGPHTYYEDSLRGGWWSLINNTAAAYLVDQNDSTAFVNAGPVGGMFKLYYHAYDSTTSRWEIKCDKLVYVDDPLPIELGLFSSSIVGSKVDLNWSTYIESNNSGFEVQRMSLDIPWTAIGFVPGAGNSTEPRSYNYEDRNLASGIYHYRLKQIDFNGNYEYFELPEAVTIGVPDKFFVDQNYPNPFNPLTTIAYGIPQAGNVVLKIFDMAGREVKALVNEYKDAGYYVAKFDGSSLASGTYIYRLESGSFVSAKKMLLLK